MAYLNPSDMNVTGWSGLLIWADYVTGYWLGQLILIAIFLIMFITLTYVSEADKAFVVSSFMTTLMALLFRGIGIIGELPLIIGIVMTAIGFLIVKKR
jgi:hypothetical protein